MKKIYSEMNLLEVMETRASFVMGKLFHIGGITKRFQYL
jgi:hypothetical protein